MCHNVSESLGSLHQCIQEGVRYLMRMLQVRNSVKLNDGVVLHDTATANFLSEGTHVVTDLQPRYLILFVCKEM